MLRALDQYGCGLRCVAGDVLRFCHIHLQIIINHIMNDTDGRYFQIQVLV